jgi:tetratricopeptide (TPR) repeat protein
MSIGRVSWFVCLFAAVSAVFASDRRVEAPSSPTRAAIHRADDLLQAGKAKEAVDLFSQVVSSESGTIDERNLALLGRGRALFALKLYDKALADMQKILDSSKGTHSSKVAALLVMSSCHRATSDYKALVADATKLLDFAKEEELLQDGVSRGSIQWLRATAYMDLGEKAKAQADCREALSDPKLPDPQKAAVYFTRATLYLSEDKKAEAAAELQHVLDIADAPDEVLGLRRKGLVQFSATRPWIKRSH